MRSNNRLVNCVIKSPALCGPTPASILSRRSVTALRRRLRTLIILELSIQSLIETMSSGSASALRLTPRSINSVPVSNSRMRGRVSSAKSASSVRGSRKVSSASAHSFELASLMSRCTQVRSLPANAAFIRAAASSLAVIPPVGSPSLSSLIGSSDFASPPSRIWYA